MMRAQPRAGRQEQVIASLLPSEADFVMRTAACWRASRQKTGTTKSRGYLTETARCGIPGPYNHGNRELRWSAKTGTYYGD
jgi:hypothetical protein